VAIVASGLSRKALAAAAIVATVVLGAQTWHKAFRPDGNDLTSYLLSARALSDGQSPYGLDTPFPYIYPLFLAFVLLPLAALPYGAAVVAWFAASVAALGAILVESAFTRIADGRRQGSDLAIAATILITFNVIQNNLLNGQVNFFVVLCCVLAVASAGPPEGGHYVGRASPGRRELVAGAWLGAAIALKLMPVLLVVYFLVRRRFRAVLVAGVTALALALAPALLMGGSGTVEPGFSRITGVYSQYARELLVPMMTTPAGNATLAYSVASVVQRVLGVGPAWWLDAICALAVLGVIVAVDVRTWRRRGADLAAAAAYLVAIVLVSPKSETHHLAFAIPAVALCFGWLFARRLAGTPTGGQYVLLSSAALVAAPFTGAAEGPMITAAMVFLIAAVTRLPTSCIQQRA
jgi:hypothetical protein